mmetsp:Transcript_48314/g.86089  ORF Transcript_48314/g.86089 Transcript_48314/m.86089 type:complete len:114 (-) Transcript_48314:352-693(-)
MDGSGCVIGRWQLHCCDRSMNVLAKNLLGDSRCHTHAWDYLAISMSAFACNNVQWQGHCCALQALYQETEHETQTSTQIMVQCLELRSPIYQGLPAGLMYLYFTVQVCAPSTI